MESFFWVLDNLLIQFKILEMYEEKVSLQEIDLSKKKR